MPSVPLPIHSYALNARTASSARLVNMYAEAAPQGAPYPVVLRSTPGIRAHVTLTGGGRGLHWVGNELFAVSGARFYRIVNGVATQIGEIVGSDRCWISNNGLAVVVLCKAGGFTWNGSTFAQISDGNFVARYPHNLDFLDGYMLSIEGASGRFFSSDLNSATDYDGLDFATAEAAPDNLVALKVDHRQIVLIGTQTTELWYNSGATGFPFERVPGGVIEIGGLSQHGVAKLDNSVVWFASDRTARRLNGATPVRISTHGVEEAWRAYAKVDDCEVFSFTSAGHVMCCFRFPIESKAWIFDATANEWHERESYLAEAWRVTATAEGLGVTYVQDAETGSVGILDGDTFAEWGETLRAEWTYQGLRDNGRRLFHEELEMGVETGVGIASGQGSDPYISLEISDDGGRQFRAIPVKSIGRQGQYRKRVKWHRLGAGRHRVYRASFSDPVPLTIWDTRIGVE